VCSHSAKNMAAMRSIELKHNSDAQGECLSSSGQSSRFPSCQQTGVHTDSAEKTSHRFGLMFHIVLTGQQSLVGLGFVAITRKDNPSQTSSG
jgi:hypothetical protein